VLSTSDVKVDHAAVAALMGPECTAKAITHRIGAIKKKASDLKENGDAGAASPKTTPKRGRAPKAEGKDTHGGPVTKKPRTTTPAKPKSQAKPAVKAEDDDKKVPIKKDGSEEEEGDEMIDE